MPAPAPHDPLRPEGPLVAHHWILLGIGTIVIAALFAIYFALGLLFWQGQWQLIMHPSHLVAQTPASLRLPFEDVRFDTTETGQPLLDGWWVPAESDLPHRQATILYVHGERGSLSDALPDVLALHALGHDVFAFDPRGYGKSVWAKPSEQHWNEDAVAALSYLESVRHIAPTRVILVGRGLGGTVAANLTVRHPAISSLVMIDPQPPTLALIGAPRWTHILPVRMLAHDRFDPAQALRSRSLNKLFLLPAGANAPAYVTQAAPPTVTVHSDLVGDAQTASALHRFFEASAAERSK